MEENTLPSYNARIIAIKSERTSSNEERKTTITTQRLDDKEYEIFHSPIRLNLNHLLHSIVEIAAKTNDQGEIFSDITPLQNPKNTPQHYVFQYPPKPFL